MAVGIAEFNPSDGFTPFQAQKLNSNFHALLSGGGSSSQARSLDGTIAGTVSVGRTVTGEPGTQAKVDDTGTNGNVVLNFTIPAGERGPKGDKGDVGPEGPQGEQGPQGEAGPSMQAYEFDELPDPSEVESVPSFVIVGDDVYLAYDHLGSPALIPLHLTDGDPGIQ